MKRRAILLMSNFVLVVMLSLCAATGVSAQRASPANTLASARHFQQGRPTVRQASSDGINLAFGKPTAASSIEDTRYHPYNAVDGNLSTRWSSGMRHGTEWFQVDLQNLYFINRVNLYWERAYAVNYQIQDSFDQTTWTTIYKATWNTGGNQYLTGLSGFGRYVRVYATRYSPGRMNFSLFEVQVYGDASAAQGPPGPAGPSGLQGDTGPMGPMGPMGPSGGPSGPQGAVGPSGPSGPQGAVGPSGPSGPQGAVGPSGPSGPSGSQGVAGNPGPLGPSGPQGVAGNPGAVGPSGSQGVAGNPGAVGPSGPSGPSGSQGVAGPSGPSGPQGDIGPTGPIPPPEYGYFSNTTPQTVFSGEDVIFNSALNAGGISLSSSSTIVVNNDGMYRLVFAVTGTGPDQFTLDVNGSPATNMEVLGSQPSTGRGLISLSAGDILTIVNTSGGDVTLQTPNGSTQTNASLLIERVGEELT